MTRRNPDAIITATHSGPRHDMDAEMVLVTVAGGQVTLEHDDGETYSYDFTELLNAMTNPLRAREAA